MWTLNTSLAVNFVMSLLVSAGPTSAVAATICEGLKWAVDHAEDGFQDRRGDFDFAFGEYQALMTMGDLDECIIESNEGQSSLKCQKIFRGDGYDREINELFERVNASIRTCFGSGVKVTYDTGNTIVYSILENDDDIRTRKRRSVLKSGRIIYRVSVEYSFVDVTY